MKTEKDIIEAERKKFAEAVKKLKDAVNDDLWHKNRTLKEVELYIQNLIDKIMGDFDNHSPQLRSHRGELDEIEAMASASLGSPADIHSQGKKDKDLRSGNLSGDTTINRGSKLQNKKSINGDNHPDTNN